MEVLKLLSGENAFLVCDCFLGLILSTGLGYYVNEPFEWFLYG